ncbi:MAG: class I SAM-dependent methyltransferase [Solirubrobacterales bacterium]
MTTVPGAPLPGRFNRDRPAVQDLSRRSHPLWYILRRLPAAIEALAPMLELRPGSRVLDYGCGAAQYRSLAPEGCQYVGADLPGNPEASVELSPDGRLPVEDASFDALLSTQVLEHVTDPELYLAESARALRPGGRMLLSTHGIMVFHPDPADHWRWTCTGLQRVVADAGFEVERFEGVVGLTATGLQLFQDGLLGRVPAAAHGPVAFVLQRLVALADRFDSEESRRYNAHVFALVARRCSSS